MKIKRLCLVNFRQFVETHTIEFSIDETQRITVIHGENGAGKTSLLNAFKWCFYGHTDFDTGEERILNERAIAVADEGQHIPLSVEITFDHDGSQYVAKRIQEFRKAGGMEVEPIGGAVLDLSWTDASGRFDKSKNSETHINQILPENMHSYFFFNGERIEKLAYASASHEIRGAIKTLMGLEIVERAKDHLSDKVKKYFSRQVKEGGASQELSQAYDRVDEIEDAIKEEKNKISNEENNIKQCEEEIQIINNTLKSIEATAHLQRERDSVNQRIKQIKKDLDEIGTQLKQLISGHGFLAFIHPVAKQVAELLEEKRLKGELPYQIKQQFINDLLQRQQCICGASLVHGSESYAAVEQYRHSAARAGLDEAFIATSGSLKQVERSRNDLFQSMRTLLLKRATMREERESLLGRLDEISKQVSTSEIEDVIGLEKKRKELHGRRDESIIQHARFQGNLGTLDKELSKAQEKRTELTKKSDQAKVARQRHEIAEECARVLAGLHEALSWRTKEQLSNKVNDTFRKILQKDYWAQIDDDYCLQIYKEIPGHGSQIVYEKSTGESQVTSLSFIGSIVSLAKEKHATEQQFFRAGIFPIVMDSPFGALDPTYREMIARYIPELADQIILFVSGTQWKGEVERECKSRVGKHISLIYPDFSVS